MKETMQVKLTELIKKIRRQQVKGLWTEIKYVTEQEPMRQETITLGSEDTAWIIKQLQRYLNQHHPYYRYTDSNETVNVKNQ